MGDVETQKEGMLQETDNRLDGVEMAEVATIACAGDENKWDTYLQIAHMEMVEEGKVLFVPIVES